MLHPKRRYTHSSEDQEWHPSCQPRDQPEVQGELVEAYVLEVRRGHLDRPGGWLDLPWVLHRAVLLVR